MHAVVRRNGMGGFRRAGAEIPPPSQLRPIPARTEGGVAEIGLLGRRNDNEGRGRRGKLGYFFFGRLRAVRRADLRRGLGRTREDVVAGRRKPRKAARTA
jgi:hypothetical protein